MAPDPTSESKLRQRAVGVTSSAAAGLASPAPSGGKRAIALSEVRAHDRPEDCWLIIRGEVYDVTRWVPQHPGGAFIHVHAGFDCTHLFDSYHPLYVQNMLAQYHIGPVAPAPTSAKGVVTRGAAAAAEAAAVPPSPAAAAADRDGVEPGPATWYDDDLSDGKFYRVLKQRVETYFKTHGLDPHASAQMNVKAACILLSLVALFYGMFWAPGVPLVLAAGFAALFGFMKAEVGMSIQHDANHGAIRGGTLCALMAASLDAVGASSYMWRQQHVVGHHAFTNVDGRDPDIRTAGKDVRRVTVTHAWFDHHAYQHLYLGLLYGLLSLKSVTVDDFSALAAGRIGNVLLARMTRSEVAVFWGGKAVFYLYYVALPLLAGTRSVGAVLLLLLIAEAVCGWTLALFFQVAHVVGEVQFPRPNPRTGRVAGGWAALQLATTADFCHGSWLWTHISGGLNYQSVHHLFPSVCHVHYPRIGPIVMATAREFGVPYNVFPSFWAALAAHFAHLKRMGAGREGVAIPSLATVG